MLVGVSVFVGVNVLVGVAVKEAVKLMVGVLDGVNDGVGVGVGVAGPVPLTDGVGGITNGKSPKSSTLITLDDAVL